jgi:hypothetical protein
MSDSEEEITFLKFERGNGFGSKERPVKVPDTPPPIEIKDEEEGSEFKPTASQDGEAGDPLPSGAEMLDLLVRQEDVKRVQKRKRSPSPPKINPNKPICVSEDGTFHKKPDSTPRPPPLKRMA